MMMRDRLQAAMKDAMRAKEAERLSTLRLINAAIKDRDIAMRGDGRGSGVSDAEILGILGKMVKQRQESARAYEEGGRLELAEKELAEIKVIEEFLPRQLDGGRGRRRDRGSDRRGGGDQHPRHGQGHGGAEGQVYRADGFRRGRAPDQGHAGLICRAGPAFVRLVSGRQGCTDTSARRSKTPVSRLTPRAFAPKRPRWN